MELSEIGLRLLGTFLSLCFGGLLFNLSNEDLFESGLGFYCVKLGSLCLIIGGTLISWFFNI
ncbi:MAG: hypothetical protein ACTSX6_04615 [Candidatus Heimdallarchaeaceae archaeon]